MTNEEGNEVSVSDCRKIVALTGGLQEKRETSPVLVHGNELLLEVKCHRTRRVKIACAVCAVFVECWRGVVVKSKQSARNAARTPCNKQPGD